MAVFGPYFILSTKKEKNIGNINFKYIQLGRSYPNKNLSLKKVYGSLRCLSNLFKFSAALLRFLSIFNALR